MLILQVPVSLNQWLQYSETNAQRAKVKKKRKEKVTNFGWNFFSHPKFPSVSLIFRHLGEIIIVFVFIDLREKFGFLTFLGGMGIE